MKLYQQQRRPLGIAQTRAARGRIYRVRGELERARDEQTEAITHVERVMQSLHTLQQQSLFLYQYAELYAQTVITDVQRHQDEQARALFHHFARLSGGDELVRHLEAYEQALPTTESEKVSLEELLSTRDIRELVRLIEAYEDALSTQSKEVSEEELLANRNIVERLKQIRRGL